MNEASIHFRIKEYIMKISFKKDLIEELKGELERLNKIKSELSQKKKELKGEYKKYEKQKKNIINRTNINKESYLNNLIYNNRINIGNNSNNNKNLVIKKRNFSAAKPKRKIGIDLLNDIKKENNQLEDILTNKNHELNNIIQNINDMEIKCKLLIFDTNKNTNLIDIQKK